MGIFKPVLVRYLWLMLAIILGTPLAVLLGSSLAAAGEPLDPQNGDVVMCEGRPDFTQERSDYLRRIVIKSALAHLYKSGQPITPAGEDCVANFAADLWDGLDQFCAYQPVDTIGYIIRANEANDRFAACFARSITTKE